MEEKKSKHQQKTDRLNREFSQPRPSKRYSAMYEDWDTFRIPSAISRKGYKTVSVYKGMYYEIDLDPKAKRRYRFSFLTVFLLIFAMFIAVSLLPFQYNTERYVGITQGITFVIFIYVAITLIIYLSAEVKMTEYLYKLTSIRLITGCTLAAVLTVVCNLSVVISLFISAEKNVLTTLIGLMGYSVCISGMLRLVKMEKALPYKSWLSTDHLPDAAD